jgi:hypothetical protein
MHNNKPSNELGLECKLERKLQHPYNNLIHIVEIKRVGGGGLMLNEIKYDEK